MFYIIWLKSSMILGLAFIASSLVVIVSFDTITNSNKSILNYSQAQIFIPQ